MSAIVPLQSQPQAALDALLDAAFGADRRRRTAYRIRAGMESLPDLSFAMLDDDGTMIGSLQSWPIALMEPDGVRSPLVMVGPVAIEPALQRAGYGRILMDHVVDRARAAGSEPLMLIGDPEYYGRFWGFSDEGTGGWDAPGPVERRRLLALSIDGRPLGKKGMLGPRVAVSA